MRDVGLDAHWHVIFGKEEFFNATKLLHNSLQGAPETLTDEQWEIFDEINEINADGLQGEWDAVIVHDPQPIGLRRGALAEGQATGSGAATSTSRRRTRRRSSACCR